MNNTENFVFIFQICLLLFLLGAIFFSLKNKSAAKIYWHFGKNIASFFVMIELIVLLLRGVVSSASYTIPLHFISVGLSITGGMILARRLKQPHLPLIGALTRAKTSHSKINWTRYLITVGIYSVGICLFTIIFFKITRPELSNYLKESVDSNASSSQVLFTSIVFFILVAFYEEIIFRFFIQNFLAYLMRRFSFGSGLAILATAFLFAIGHYGILATWWVKFTQTFVIGLALGHLMKKYGLETSFAVHSVLNIFALYSSQFLINP